MVTWTVKSLIGYLMFGKKKDADMMFVVMPCARGIESHARQLHSSHFNYSFHLWMGFRVGWRNIQQFTNFCHSHSYAARAEDGARNCVTGAHTRRPHLMRLKQTIGRWWTSSLRAGILKRSLSTSVSFANYYCFFIAISTIPLCPFAIQKGIHILHERRCTCPIP